MPFDPKRYEDEVIKPLRGYRGPLPAGDLVRRYAIEPGLSSDTEIADRVRRVRTYWSQNSNSNGNRSSVCRTLIAADEELKRGGARLDTLAYWQNQRQQEEGLRRDAIRKLADDLATSFAGIGKLADAQLDAIVRQHPGLSRAHIDEAVRLAGLQAVAGVDLPTESGLDRTQYTSLQQKLATIGAATLVQLLHPDLKQPFRLLRSFDVAGQPAARLDRATLDGQITKAEALADSDNLRARKEALGVLRSAADRGVDLRVLALYQLVDRIRSGTGTGTQLPFLVRAATDMGLERSEAELVALSIPTGPAAPAASPADEVRAMLEQGHLRAAQKAVAALPSGDAQTEAVRALVEQAQATVERLVREAIAAQSANREDEARRLLLQAQTSAQDDDDLANRLRTLPMPPPADVSAVEADAVVRLAWRAPSSAAAGVRFRVVRTEGRVATSPQDGATVAETTELSAVDGRAPVARPLHYSVFASQDAKTWSRPASVAITVVPSVGAVTLRADQGRVTITWRAHPDAARITVRRTEHRPPTGPSDGKPLAASAVSAVDTSVIEGVEYFYTVVAIYRDAQGREVAGPPARGSIVPRAAATAVQSLDAQTVSVVNDIARIRLSWPASPAHGTVRIRYADRPPTWPPSTIVPPADLAQYGQEAVGEVRRAAGMSTMEVDVPAGYHVFAAFAIGGTGAVVGATVGLGVVEAVAQLEARRTGARTTLSWVWPPDIRLAEVTWPDVSGRTLTRRVTFADYKNSVVITASPAGGLVSVRAIAVGAQAEAKSPPATLVLEPQALRLSYRLARPGAMALWRKPWVATITVDTPCQGVDLSLVGCTTSAIPMRAEQGKEIERFASIRLNTGEPFTFEFRPPRGVRWVRCFVHHPDNVTVIDPPIDEMKVD